MASPADGGRDRPLQDSARHALLREQLLVPANAILAYGQLLAGQAPPRQPRGRLPRPDRRLGAPGHRAPGRGRCRPERHRGRPGAPAPAAPRPPLAPGGDQGLRRAPARGRRRRVPREDLERLVQRAVEILRRVDELGRGRRPRRGHGRARRRAGRDRRPAARHRGRQPRAASWSSTTTRTTASSSRTSSPSPATRWRWPNRAPAALAALERAARRPRPARPPDARP